MYCNTKKRRENEESKNKTKNIIAIKLKILIKKGGEPVHQKFWTYPLTSNPGAGAFDRSFFSVFIPSQC
jgi:hypothetical protein